MAKPILTVRVTTRAGMSFDLSVIVIRNVVCDNPSAHRIKATLGITGLSRLIVHIDNAVWHLDVDSSFTWGCKGSQGFGCSPIKRVRELSLEQRELVRILSTRKYWNLQMLLALYERTRKYGPIVQGIPVATSVIGNH